MADPGETTQGSSTSSTTSTPRRRAAPKRRKTAGAGASRTGAKTAGGKGTASRKSSGAGGRSRRPRATGRRSRKQAPSLAGLLGTLQKRATEAGSRIAALSGESAEAAKRAVGTLTESSRKTLQGVRQEWNRMDTPAKTRFVAALLGTLAAASGSVVASRRRKK